MNNFPWYTPEPSTPIGTGLRGQINELQSRELFQLRLVNEFLRSQVAAADAGTPQFLTKAACV